jgi:hypothetical protein
LTAGLHPWYYGFMASSIHETMKPVKKRSTETGTPVQVRLQPEPLDAVDEWRRQQPDLPNRAEALRRLTTLALEAEAAKKKSRGK